MAERFFTDISAERSQRYRRNVLALCSLLIVIHVFPGLDFDRLNFFGITSGEWRSVEFITAILWILIGYHAIFYAYLSLEDWLDWRAFTFVERKTQDFPEVRMFFGQDHPRLPKGGC